MVAIRNYQSISTVNLGEVFCRLQLKLLVFRSQYTQEKLKNRKLRKFQLYYVQTSSKIFRFHCLYFLGAVNKKSIIIHNHIIIHGHIFQTETYPKKHEKRKMDDLADIAEGGDCSSERSELVPKDKGRMVYWIILLNGIGVLLPWNMFITIAPEVRVFFKNY